MSKMIKMEFERAFRSKTMTISLLVGLAIVLVQYFFVSFPYRNDILTYYSGSVGTYPISAFKLWIELDSVHPYLSIYLTLFPFLAVLPYGLSYFFDLKSGYVKEIYARIDRKAYLWAKFLAVFVSGGVVVLLPVLLNLFLHLMTFPALNPIATSGFYLCAVQLYADIYYTNPVLFFAIYMVMYFIYGGAFACVGLAVSKLFDYSFFVLISPFVIYYGMGILSPYLKNSYVKTTNPVYLLMMGQPGGVTALSFYGTPIFILAVVLIVYFWRSKHYDIL